MSKEALRKKLDKEIDTLPTDDLPQVLDLVERLKARRKGRLLSPLRQEKPDPAKNPLRGLLGIAEAEPFAHRIDKDLYEKNQ